MFPTLITGEPRRDYNFSWIIIPRSIVGGLINASYVSQLAQKVELPEDNYNTKDIAQGIVEFKIPIGISLNPIKVSYLEDDFGSVYNSQRLWMNLPRQQMKSLTLNTMYKYSGIGLYLPSTSHLVNNSTVTNIISSVMSGGLGFLRGADDGGEIPTGYEIFSHIFPINIQRTAMDKGGQGFAGVTVTYCRLPSIKLPAGKKPCFLPKKEEPAGVNAD